MRFLLTTIFVLLISPIMAQMTVTGTIKDGNGEPLPGATVTIKGTTKGSVANIDGKYSIKVANGEAVLVYTFVGFEPKEVTVGAQTVIDVVLTQGQALEEVVVTGYGKKKLFGGIRIRGKSSIKNKSLRFTPDPISNDESYDLINENGFQGVGNKPLSTFSIDVDVASYANVRRYLNGGSLPPKDAVRIEEMINYFSYDYEQPRDRTPFSINTEVAKCPWNKEHKLVQIGLQGLKVDQSNLPPSNLVFLLDVSGSMGSANKLPLLKDAFKILVKQLRPEDRVAIVVYAGAAGTVLPSTSGANKNKIINALNRLEAGGSTAGGAGIELAYKIATENLIEDGNNRVILATDGDFNVGASSDSEMTRLIEKKRETGIFLTCLGFGMGNYKDSKMEKLADKGNGNYAYIDSEREAKKVLATEFGGTLFTIAKDVKIQVEFNPTKVQAYRLIGYENRLLNDEDFKDDKKDAGELGSGHTVTALYEVIPVGVQSEFTKKLPKLKYSKVKSTGKAKSDELLNVKLRYKQPKGTTSQLVEKSVDDSNTTFEASSDDFRFAVAVAGFGMQLRGSEFIGSWKAEDIEKVAKSAKGEDKHGNRKEFIELVRKFSKISKEG